MFMTPGTKDVSRSESSQLRWYLRSAYRRVGPMLPEPVRHATRTLDVVLNRRPRIWIDKAFHPPAGLPRGVITISLDFELAWGWLYSTYSGLDIEDMGMTERLQVPQILRQMEEYDIPGTWATVGHLFLESCTRGTGGHAHPDMPRLRPFVHRNWRFSSGDWFQHDPCSDVSRAPAWYGPDLIEMILASGVRHEIGCHTFSHAGFGPYCPAEVVEAEIDACILAMEGFGLRPRTLVFPRNDVGHFDILGRKGISVTRSFPVSGNIVSLPVLRSDGVWAVHSSTGVDYGGQWTWEQRLARLKTFADVAARRNLAMHVWLHPSLLKTDMLGVFFPFMRYCAGLRDRGIVDILTMSDLVDATRRAGGSAI